MPFTTLSKNLIIESSSSPKKASSSPKKASSSPKKASSSPKKYVPIQEEIDRYINNKLLNIKRDKNAIIMVGTRERENVGC